MEEPQEVQDEEYERVWERVAAVDVAKASGVVCTRVPDEARPGLIRHPGADHPGCLGHVDRGDSLVNTLVLLVPDLLRFLHSQATSSS